MSTTKYDVMLATVERLQSDFTAFQTELKNKPFQVSTRSGRQLGKRDSPLQTILPKLEGWSEILQTLHSQAKEARTEAQGHIVSSIAVAADQQAMDRVTSDAEMNTQSENASRISIFQQKIPQQSPAHVTSPAQTAQPSASENRTMGGSETADSLSTTNGDNAEVLDDSQTDTREETTIYVSKPHPAQDSTAIANGQPQEAASRVTQSTEDASMENIPGVDNGSAIVEVSRQNKHANVASRHRETQPIITTEMEEEQANVDQTNCATESQSLHQCLELSQEAQKGLTYDAPSDVQAQLSRLSRDHSILWNLDDILTSADDNSTQSTTTQDFIQQEDMEMADAEPEVTQRIAILAPVAQADDRRPATPNLARPDSNPEVASHSEWLSQSSDTSRTVSPACSTASGTDSVRTRLTTPDSTSMGEQVNNLTSSDGITSIYERYIIESEDTTTLRPGQLGRNMPKTFSELSEKPGYAYKVSLPWIAKVSPSDIKEELKQEGDADVQFNKFERKDANGIIVSRDDPIKGRKFEWPDFKKIRSSMTARHASLELERFLADPKEAVSYYCGLMKSPFLDSCPLYSGEQLDIKELTHVNEPYTHLGKKGSATAMHKEDDVFGSVNVGFLGTKLFLRILTEDTIKFETWVRSIYTCKPCLQFVRHLNIFFEPRQLAAAGIRFEILIQRPGDLIETKPQQYHQVVNIEDSLAISINFLFPGITPNFLDADHPLEVCNECGLKGLCGRPGFHVLWVDPRVPAPRSSLVPCKRKALSKGPAKTTRAGTATQRELAEIQKELADIQYRHPQINRQNLTLALGVYKHAAVVQSTSAVQQFIDLLGQWRQQQSQNVFNINSTKSPLDKAMALVRHYMGKSRLDVFCLRLSQMTLSREAEKLKGPTQRIHSAEFLDDLSARNHMSKKTLKSHLRDGRQWDRLCNSRHGLLAFIPLDKYNDFGITKEDWIWLSQSDNAESAQVFHQLLDDNYMESLCAAGRLFENMISGKTSIVFLWEESGLDLNADNIHIQLQEHKILEGVQGSGLVR